MTEDEPPNPGAIRFLGAQTVGADPDRGANSVPPLRRLAGGRWGKRGWRRRGSHEANPWVSSRRSGKETDAGSESPLHPLVMLTSRPSPCKNDRVKKATAAKRPGKSKGVRFGFRARSPFACWVGPVGATPTPDPKRLPTLAARAHPRKAPRAPPSAAGRRARSRARPRRRP